MTKTSTRKPLLDWDVKVLKERMRELGFDVEFIRKPEMIPDLKSAPYKNLDSIDNLSDDSKGRILDYLDELGADGGLVVDKQAWTIEHDHVLEFGNITIAPYRLHPQSKPS
jgi:hypothetical protein